MATPAMYDIRSQSLASGVNSLLSTLKQTQTYDYLRASSNADLTKFLYNCSRKDAPPSLSPPTTETIFFADDVIKINRKQKRQERVLIITNKALYNFAPGSYKSAKRRIFIRDLRGVILSRSSDEIVFQVSDSYDYRYEIRRRSECLEMLSKAYERETEERFGSPQIMMVTFSEEKELRDMVITKDLFKNFQATNPNVSGHAPVQVDIIDHHQPTQSQTIPTTPSSSTSSNQLSHSPQPTAAGTPNGAGGSPSHSNSATSNAALNSPTSANAAAAAGATPATPQNKPAKNMRQSLITHGASLLSPHILAKLQQHQSGNFPAMARQSHIVGGGSGQFAASTKGALGGPMNYHAHKHASVIMTNSHGMGLLPPQAAANTLAGSAPNPMTSGMYSMTTNRPNRSASKTLSKHPSSNTNHAHTMMASTSSVTIIDENFYAAPTSGASGNSAAGTTAAVANSGAAATALTQDDVDSNTNLHAFRDPNSRLEGWLTKQKGSNQKKWDRKYFILTNRSLQYYSPRIKSNIKLKSPVSTSRFNSDISLNSPSASSKSNLGPMFTDDTPLIMLRIESSTHLTKKDALILAFASEEDASVWSEAFLNRNNDFPPSEIDQYIHIEGWLLKKEKNNKWVRRYVVLTQDRVWFFEMALKGSVEFTKGASAHNSNIIQPTEEIQSNNFAGRYALTRFAYRWNVSDSVRIFHVAADSEEDMNMWIEAIENVNREHGKGGGVLNPSYFDEESASNNPSHPPEKIQLPDEFIESVEQQAPEGQVTFVFTDVQNSTNLWEKVPDAMDQALEQHDRILRELLKKYNGYEVKTEGDAFMVTFFTAMDAVLWCLAVQVALLEAEWSDEFCTMSAAKKETIAGDDGNFVTVFNGIRIRMGIHTGYPNARRNPVTGRMDYFGPVVNRSARVSDTGHGGQIVCTQEVIEQLNEKMAGEPRLADPVLHPLIEDMGMHSLKGIVEQVRIYQLMPNKLKLRTLPPIRTSTNEKLAAEKEKNNKSASATPVQQSPTNAAVASASAPPVTTISVTPAASASNDSTAAEAPVVVGTPSVPSPPDMAGLSIEE